MHAEDVFHSLFPGFFQDGGIRSLPENEVFTELVMDLRECRPDTTQLHDCPGITFGEYHGKLEPLHHAVRQVDEDWVQYFVEGDSFYCAMEEGKIVAFCCLSDLGWFQGLHIGGPGCVGTIPAYRRRGIGLAMVQRATEALWQKGFDFSWIHYTHLEHWYRKLEYRPVLRWNSSGIIQSASIIDTGKQIEIEVERKTLIP